MPQVNLGRVGYANKGSWVDGLHKVNDIVMYLGGVYACKVQHTSVSGDILPTNVAYWDLWVDADNVNLTGDQTISGIKTFNSSPIIPDATLPAQPLSFGQFSGKMTSDIHAALAKATPVDGDEFPLVDSSDSFVLKKMTGTILKAYLKTYNDTLYPALVGSLVKEASYTTGEVATGTTIIPLDNTIPQITEGTQFMSYVYPPKYANSIIYVLVSANFSLSVAGHIIIALFDGTSDALAVRNTVTSTSNAPKECSLLCAYNNGSITPKTFSVRAGGNSASTITFNGSVGARYFGGAYNSTMVILEVAI
jgi:hypothetical protein